jgi:V/A-type H+-transporting ATPase subunit E
VDSLAKDKEALISGIEADANTEVKRILAEARKQADEKGKYSAQKVQSILAEAREKAQEQAQKIKRRIIADAELEVKRRFLRLRDTIMHDIIEKAKARLNAIIHEENYRDVLVSWITEAAIGLDVESAEINASQKELLLIDDKLLFEVSEKVKKQTSRQITLVLSNASPLESQGVVLTSSDGRIAFNNQVETRLLRKQREIGTMIYNELFTDDKET